MLVLPSSSGAAAAGLALLGLLARSAEAAAISTDGGLASTTLAKVKANLAAHDSDTWVAGTEAEALTELDYPSRSVFSPTAFSASSPVPSSANAVVASWASKLSSTAVQFASVSGGAAGDPASLGVAWIQSGVDKDVVTNEVNYLTKTVPRTSSGAISTRPPGETVQLWADFTYMVPPFLAYYGVSEGNPVYLDTAYKQIKLYRDALLDEDSGLWKHIVLGDWQSTKLWSPGNGWAAAGITRVYATIKHSPYAAQYEDELEDLANWATDILENAFDELRSTNLLPNVFGVDPGATFSDGGASALLASVAYRLAALGVIPDNGSLIDTAEKIRLAVEAGVGSDGWLSPVSDPLTFTDKGSQSPEAEAFVLLMEAAWVDWKTAA